MVNQQRGDRFTEAKHNFAGAIGDAEMLGLAVDARGQGSKKG